MIKSRVDNNDLIVAEESVRLAEGIEKVLESRPALKLSKTNRRRLARNRWQLAFMLFQNPSLRQYRGHFIELESHKRDFIASKGSKSKSGPPRRSPRQLISAYAPLVVDKMPKLRSRSRPRLPPRFYSAVSAARRKSRKKQARADHGESSSADVLRCDSMSTSSFSPQFDV